MCGLFNHLLETYPATVEVEVELGQKRTLKAAMNLSSGSLSFVGLKTVQN